MAETGKPKKEHKIVSASEGKEVTAEKTVRAEKTAEKAAKPAQDDAPAHEVKQAAPTGNATGLRIGAVILWVLAIAFEIIGICVFQGKLVLTFMPTLYQLIALVVLDLACVIIGAQLWKKANHIDPASEANKVKFWLWNNMGVIVAIVAFVPFIVLLLLNKQVDGKTKKIAAIVAIVALLIGGISSYDFNPVSSEQKEAAVSALGTTQVLWTPYGHVYHTHEDCQALNQTDTLTQGTVDEAIAAGRTRLCKFCAARDNITGVTTDGDAAAVAASVADTAAEAASSSLSNAA